MHRKQKNLIALSLNVLAVMFLFATPTTNAFAEHHTEAPDVVTLVQVLAGSPAEQRTAIRKLRGQWQDAFVSPLVEMLRLNRDRDTQIEIVNLLEGKTNQRFGADYQKWHQWVWANQIEPVKNYAEFKSWLYGNIDPKFSGYFANDRELDIRLDEVVWGGVNQDGIPPLRQPKMISAADATYLEDDHVVFAIAVNGDYRAFPKRILGWHEMVVDTVGGVDLVGVYCTLCGAMIIYETALGSANYEFGTSGFLYRSNKLMYDQATQSLWNSFWGRPVIGPLVNKGIELKRRSVVTTTWGDWKARHPETTVLSIDTGYNANYDEGNAYKNYFATDKLMFKVPLLDTRLKNKAEILGIRLSANESSNEPPLAISADYLKRNPLYVDEIGGKPIVVLTDRSGANRVYEGDVAVVEWDQVDQLVDQQGNIWKMTEAAITSENGQTRNRVPAHRAFWFGWFAAFGDTRLVH